MASCSTSTSVISTAGERAREWQAGRSEVPRFPQVEGGFRGRERPRPSGPARCPGHRRLVPPRAHGLPVQPGPERLRRCLRRRRGSPSPHRSCPRTCSTDPRDPERGARTAGNPSVLPSGVAPLGSRSLARHEARQRNHRLRIVLAALPVARAGRLAVWYVAQPRPGPEPDGPGRHRAGPASSCCRSPARRSGRRRPPRRPARRRRERWSSLPTQLTVDVARLRRVTLQRLPRCPAGASADGVADALGSASTAPGRSTSRASPPLSTAGRRHRRRLDVQVKQGDGHQGPRRPAAPGRRRGCGVRDVQRPRRARPRRSSPASTRSSKPSSVASRTSRAQPPSRSPRSAPSLAVQPAARAARGRAGAPARAGRRGHRSSTAPSPCTTSIPAPASRRTPWTPPALRSRSATSPAAPQATRRARAASASWSATGSAPPGSEQRHGPSSTRRDTCTSPAATSCRSTATETVILITEDSPEQRALGEKVAAALGVGRQRAADLGRGPEHRRRRRRAGDRLPAVRP